MDLKLKKRYVVYLQEVSVKIVVSIGYKQKVHGDTKRWSLKLYNLKVLFIPLSVA